MNKYRLIVNSPFSGHTIISYGLIVYARNTDKFIIIQRKHSVEFLILIRGFYRKSYLPILLNKLTETELDKLKQFVNNPLEFIAYYLTDLKLNLKGLSYAHKRFKELLPLLPTLLSNISVSNNQLAWSFPKGRMEVSVFQETPFECAMREFIEEVEVQLPPATYISDNYLTHNIHTITGRDIQSRFWIYVVENEFPLPKIQDHDEIVDRIWVTRQECQYLLNDNDFIEYIFKIIDG